MERELATCYWPGGMAPALKTRKRNLHSRGAGRPASRETEFLGCQNHFVDQSKHFLCYSDRGFCVDNQWRGSGRRPEHGFNMNFHASAHRVN